MRRPCIAAVAVVAAALAFRAQKDPAWDHVDLAFACPLRSDEGDSLTDDAFALDGPCHALDLAFGAEAGVMSTVLHSTAFHPRNCPASEPAIAAWEDSVAVALASLLKFGVDRVARSCPGGGLVA